MFNSIDFILKIEDIKFLNSIIKQYPTYLNDSIGKLIFYQSKNKNDVLLLTEKGEEFFTSGISAINSLMKNELTKENILIMDIGENDNEPILTVIQNKDTFETIFCEISDFYDIKNFPETTRLIEIKKYISSTF